MEVEYRLARRCSLVTHSTILISTIIFGNFCNSFEVVSSFGKGCFFNKISSKKIIKKSYISVSWGFLSYIRGINGIKIPLNGKLI